jgi:hypothetical protein
MRTCDEALRVFYAGLRLWGVKKCVHGSKIVGKGRVEIEEGATAPRTEEKTVLKTSYLRSNFSHCFYQPQPACTPPH